MESDRTTSHVLEGRELIDYLIEKTSTLTNAELLEREDRRNRRTTILMAMGRSDRCRRYRWCPEAVRQRRNDRRRDQNENHLCGYSDLCG